MATKPIGRTYLPLCKYVKDMSFVGNSTYEAINASQHWHNSLYSYRLLKTVLTKASKTDE